MNKTILDRFTDCSLDNRKAAPPVESQQALEDWERLQSGRPNEKPHYITTKLAFATITLLIEICTTWARAQVSALAIMPLPLFTSQQKRIVDIISKHRFPAIFSNADFVEAGGFISYGPNLVENYRRAATYVDKILKGAKPTDLPIEQPTKLELVINLNAAKEIGVTIPPNALARADRVIR